MRYLGKVCLLMLIGSIQCFSATIYTVRTTFLSAVGPVTNIDFEGLAALGSNADFSSAAGLTLDGVNFVGTETTCDIPPLSNPPGNVTCGSPASSLSVNNSNGNVWGSGAYLVLPAYNTTGISRLGATVTMGNVTITFPAGVFAFGTDAMSGLVTGTTALLTLSDGSTANVSFGNFAGELSNPPTRDFFGVVSSDAITSATLAFDEGSQFEQGLIDNFVFETAAVPTPEPSALALMAVAVATLALLCAFRKRSDAAR